MDVKEVRHFAGVSGGGCVFCGVAIVGGGAMTQAPNPSSAANPFYGSVTVHAVSDEPLKLSLDDAIRRGLENNLGLKEAESGEKLFPGRKERGAAAVFADDQPERRHRRFSAQPGGAGIWAEHAGAVWIGCFRADFRRGFR